MDEIKFLGSPPEPCRMVKDFEELREGMVVYAGPCPCHKKRWRGMLTERRTEDLHRGLGSPAGVSDCFSIVPPPDGNDRIRINAGFVAMGQVYRIVDLKLEAETAARTKSKAKPKAGVR